MDNSGRGGSSFLGWSAAAGHTPLGLMIEPTQALSHVLGLGHTRMKFDDIIGVECAVPGAHTQARTGAHTFMLELTHSLTEDVDTEGMECAVPGAHAQPIIICIPI